MCLFCGGNVLSERKSSPSLSINSCRALNEPDCRGSWGSSWSFCNIRYTSESSMLVKVLGLCSTFVQYLSECKHKYMLLYNSDKLNILLLFSKSLWMRFHSGTASCWCNLNSFCLKLVVREGNRSGGNKQPEITELQYSMVTNLKRRHTVELDAKCGISTKTSWTGPHRAGWESIWINEWL